jgi:hypothetical protein
MVPLDFGSHEISNRKVLEFKITNELFALGTLAAARSAWEFKT